MSPQPRLSSILQYLCLVSAIASASALRAYAQAAQPPAYLAVVTGEATLERGGVAEPATANMPFIAGDRLRTAAGRVEIVFPDGSAIEVGEDSEVEAVSATRVRLIAGTMDHIQRPVASSRSASYLPQDLQPYGTTFDQYGSWQYDQPHGYVWYPQVGPDWRPYSYGSWSPIRSYGWTWVGLEAWAWPTHHYGRWGFARNAWFWIPGRTWGAAWVSWSFADDYVSWCPLGFDSRPIFALSIGSRRGWDYWTVPRRVFETRGYGRSYAGSYRGGDREWTVGRREPFRGDRNGRSAVNDRTTDADRRSPTAFGGRQEAGTSLPAANGGAIAMPRVGPRDPNVNRDSGLGLRNRPPTTDAGRSTTDYRPGIDQRRPTADYRRPATDSRPSSDYRRPTTDYRPPTPDFRHGADVAVPRATAPDRAYMPSPSYRAREQGYTPRTNGPAASSGAIAMPRFESRPIPDSRPTTDYRRPTPDSRPPTIDSRPREAPAASGGAPALRPMPHERAAPSGGDARPRAQERSAPAAGESRGRAEGRRQR